MTSVSVRNIPQGAASWTPLRQYVTYLPKTNANPQHCTAGASETPPPTGSLGVVRACCFPLTNPIVDILPKESYT